MRPFNRLFIAVILVIAAPLATVPAAAATEKVKTSPEKAAAFIDALSLEALNALRSDGLTLEEREAKVRVILRRSFDFQLIGRFVLGKAWRKASPEQREEYQGLFEEYVLLTYSRRLSGYTDETITVVKSGPMGKQDAVVLTEISRPSGRPIRAGWRIREKDGTHLILDVIVEGVSMLTTQRSEFRSTVRSRGLDGLLELLRMQVSKFSAQPS